MPEHITEYKMLKIIEETENAKYYTAESGSGVYLVCEFRDREAINLHMADFIRLSPESLPEFAGWFSENSAFYFAFKYAEGVPILKYIEKEKLPFDYRLIMAKNVIFRLRELETAPPVLQKAVITPGNVVICEGSVSFNYKVELGARRLDKSDIYHGISEFLSELFTYNEIAKNKGLKIVLDKCDKNIYEMYGEVLKDLDSLLKDEAESLDLKKAVAARHKDKLKKARAVIIAVCFVAAMGLLYWEYAVKSKEGVPVFVPVEEIGNVRVEEYREEGDALPVADGGRQIVYVGSMPAPALPPVPEKIPLPVSVEPELRIEPQTPEYEFYTVKSGDNLTRISFEYYNSKKLFRKIAEYNQLKNPDLIFPGQQIKLPSVEILEGLQ